MMNELEKSPSYGGKKAYSLISNTLSIEREKERMRKTKGGGSEYRNCRDYEAYESNRRLAVAKPFGTI